MISAVVFSCIWTGCSDDIVQQKQTEEDVIIVPMQIAASEYETDEATKALAPYIPDVENLIHDIWVVQYSSRGILLPSSIYHYRTAAPPALVVTDLYYQSSTTSGVALVESAEPCTVCFIANMGDNVPEWPDNIYAFQEIMMPVLDSDASVELEKIPMCGYYHGPVTHGTQVDASLGRMITRINLIINNWTGEDISNLVVSITNAPRYAHIYPYSDTTPLNEAETASTRPLRDAGMSIAAGESLKLYYYMAPNLYGESWPTTLWTTCHLDSTDQDAKGGIILGDTVPSEAEQDTYPPVVNPDRNLKLYSNNQYTFTINYVNMQ